jgi:hypothetical protein
LLDADSALFDFDRADVTALEQAFGVYPVYRVEPVDAGPLCDQESGKGTARSVRSKSDWNIGDDVSDRLPKALLVKIASHAREHTH